MIKIPVEVQGLKCLIEDVKLKPYFESLTKKYTKIYGGKDHGKMAWKEVNEKLYKSVPKKGFWVGYGAVDWLNRHSKEISFDVTNVSPARGELTKPLIVPEKLKNHPKFTVRGKERYYFYEALEACFKHPLGTIKLPTGAGKTVVQLTLAYNQCKYIGTGMILVPTLIIKEQFIESGRNFGIEIVDYADFDINDCENKIYITTHHIVCNHLKNKEKKKETLKKLNKVNWVGIDECFPYSQKVLTSEGAIKIGTLFNKFKKKERLPLVKSWNEKFKCFEEKRILKVFKNSDKIDLLEIKSSRLRIKCTPNHEFLTKEGWKRAYDLTPKDLLLGSYGNSNRQQLGGYSYNEDQWDIIIGSFLGDGCFNTRSKHKYTLKIIHGIKQKEYLLWKKGILNSRKSYFIKEAGYSGTSFHKFETPVFCSLEHFPCPKTTCPDWIINKLNLKSLAIWFMDDGSTSLGTNENLTVTFSTESFDLYSQSRLVQKLEELGFSSRLQHYSRGEKKYTCIRLNKDSSALLLKAIAPYVHSNCFYKYKEFYQEFLGTYNWDYTLNKELEYTIDYIKPYKYTRKKDEGYGLFDLEVEDNHNYVIGSDTLSGVIVHNCAHATCASWFDILLKLENCERCHGFSALPVAYETEDGESFHDLDPDDARTIGIMGPVLYEKSAHELSDFLNIPKLINIKYQWPEAHPLLPNKDWEELKTSKTWHGIKKAVEINEDRLFFIVNIYKHLIEHGYKIITFVSSKKYGETLLKLCDSPYIACWYGSGKAFTKDRKMTVEELREDFGTKLLGLILTSHGIEGLDFSNPLNVLLLHEGKDIRRTTQMTGRIARPDDKPSVVLNICDRGCFILPKHSDQRSGDTVTEFGSEFVNCSTFSDFTEQLQIIEENHLKNINLTKKGK